MSCFDVRMHALDALAQRTVLTPIFFYRRRPLLLCRLYGAPISGADRLWSCIEVCNAQAQRHQVYVRTIAEVCMPHEL